MRANQSDIIVPPWCKDGLGVTHHNDNDSSNRFMASSSDVKSIPDLASAARKLSNALNARALRFFLGGGNNTSYEGEVFDGVKHVVFAATTFVDCKSREDFWQGITFKNGIWQVNYFFTRDRVDSSFGIAVGVV